MNEKTVFVFLAVMGGVFVLSGVVGVSFAVYIELVSQKGVSTQLAGLIAIPLGSGAAMIKGAFDRYKRLSEDKESEGA